MGDSVMFWEIREVWKGLGGLAWRPCLFCSSNGLFRKRVDFHFKNQKSKHPGHPGNARVEGKAAPEKDAKRTPKRAKMHPGKTRAEPIREI